MASGVLGCGKAEVAEPAPSRATASQNPQFARNDWTNAEIERPCEGDILAKVRKVIFAHVEINLVEHMGRDLAPLIHTALMEEDSSGSLASGINSGGMKCFDFARDIVVCDAL